MAKFERMDANYDIQSVSDELTEDMETAHKKVYDEAKARYKKAMLAAVAVLDARAVPAAPTVHVQPARPPARIVEDLRPKEKLTSTMSLEAMRAWAEQYRNFMAQNEKAFEEQGLKTARAYLTGSIDMRLATRLKTMRGEDGNLKVSDETSVEDVLKVLEGIYIEAKPLWVQRTNYFKEVQGTNENFDDFWARKMVLKDACQLNKGITAEDLDVLEILRGVHSHELRKKLLEVKNPKPNELIEIARRWQYGKDMEKQFESTVRGAKASDYRQGKDEAQKAKAAEVAEAKAKDKDKGKSSDTKTFKCWGCAKVVPTRDDLTKH